MTVVNRNSDYPAQPIERILDQEDALKVHFCLVSSTNHGYAAMI